MGHMSIYKIAGAALLTAGLAACAYQEGKMDERKSAAEAVTIEETLPQSTQAPRETGVDLHALAAQVVSDEELIPSDAAELIGRTIWGEAGGVPSATERAAVAWCVLNRADAWEQSIGEVVTAPLQFQGYRPEEIWGECPQEHIDLAEDVLERWLAEKDGAEDVGRVLPAEYLYFIGDGEHNYFSAEYMSGDYWDWSLVTPY